MVTNFTPAPTAKTGAAPVASGQFANIKNNPVQQTVAFKKTTARYIRFVATSPADEKQAQAAIAELGVVTR